MLRSFFLFLIFLEGHSRQSLGLPKINVEKILTSGWAWLFAQPLSDNVVVKSLMHSEGQNKEGSVNVGTRLESLTLEAFQACLQKNNDYESGITKCFLGFYVSKKRAILFYFLQPASIQLLVFALGASVPWSKLVQLRTFLSAAPAWESSQGVIYLHSQIPFTLSPF